MFCFCCLLGTAETEHIFSCQYKAALQLCMHQLSLAEIILLYDNNWSSPTLHVTLPFLLFFSIFLFLGLLVNNSMQRAICCKVLPWKMEIISSCNFEALVISATGGHFLKTFFWEKSQKHFKIRWFSNLIFAASTILPLYFNVKITVIHDKV